MLEYLPDIFANYKETCSIMNLRNGCVTFARNRKYLKYLMPTDKHILAVVPFDTQLSVTPNVHLLKAKYPEYIFTVYHNHLYRNYIPTQPYIGFDCKIHKTVVMDVDGLKVVNRPDGKKIQFKHTGGVLIENNVEIGPYTVIHRGTLDNTTIESGCKIGAHNNIGHNCMIGQDTVIAAGVILNGGITIGKSCWIASGVMIKHYTNICDNVVIGLGSVVTKDITEPGIYIGNPARYLKPITKGWNF